MKCSKLSWIGTNLHISICHVYFPSSNMLLMNTRGLQLNITHDNMTSPGYLTPNNITTYPLSGLDAKLFTRNLTLKTIHAYNYTLTKPQNYKIVLTQSTQPFPCKLLRGAAQNIATVGLFALKVVLNERLEGLASL